VAPQQGYLTVMLWSMAALCRHIHTILIDGKHAVKHNLNLQAGKVQQLHA
jgi:hypothetical protein